MKQTLEYIFSDEMLELLDHFTSLTEVRIAFFSLEGEELCIGKDRSICGYCRLRRKEKAFNATCLSDDAEGRSQALRKEGIHFYQCHANLCEAVIPIYIGDMPIGFAMIGQFRLAGSDGDSRNAKEQSELLKLPTFTKEKVEDLLSMFQVLINHISNQSLVARRDYDLLSPVIKSLRENPEQNLSLQSAAQQVGLSPSRLSHLFTSRMGTNFKQFQVSQKLARAEQLMTLHPDWPIRKTAESSGFSDPYYFSRIYKKYRGFPPSKFSANN